MNRELILLGLLRQENMHGYQIHEFINRNMSSCLDLKKPTAYYLLEKMTAMGWIEALADQEGNRPPRHVFKMTEEGERAFQRLLRENVASYHGTQFPDDIGLAFLDALPADEARALLGIRLKAVTDALHNAETIPQHAGSSQIVIEHLIHHLKSEIEWLNKVLSRID